MVLQPQDRTLRKGSQFSLILWVQQVCVCRWEEGLSAKASAAGGFRVSEALSNHTQGEQSELSAACRGKPGLRTDFHDLRIFVLLQATGKISDSSCTTTWWLLEPHLGWRCALTGKVQEVTLGSKPRVNRTYASDDPRSWWTQPSFLQGQARLPTTHPI